MDDLAHSNEMRAEHDYWQLCECDVVISKESDSVGPAKAAQEEAHVENSNKVRLPIGTSPLLKLYS